MLTTDIFTSITLTLLTLALYQTAAFLQQKWQFIWLNPLLITSCILVPSLLITKINYHEYTQAVNVLTLMLEPAIVALGYPLYLQLRQIRFHYKQILSILTLAIIIVISLSLTSAMLLISAPKIAIALSLKSVTTPIGIALTEQLAGDSSITAFSIMIAGLFGALLGPKWLLFIGVKSPKAQGLAIGAASHVIGTAVLAKISSEHAAYSSVALIFSALLTALISPWLLPLLLSLYN
jgi:putative effector of murein hydrolase